jgi:hypothetical protein
LTWLPAPTYARPAIVENPHETYADDDPEYETDHAADPDDELSELRPSDPATMPPDEGDVGHAEPPGEGDVGHAEPPGEAG